LAPANFLAATTVRLSSERYGRDGIEAVGILTNAKERFYKWKALGSFAREGVEISPDADLLSHQGIKIGKGTWIDKHATIAANELNTRLKVYSPNKGTIDIGEDCEIHRGTIIASYGGEIIIGNQVSINPYGVVYGHGGLEIGDFCRIATGVVIIPSNHNFSDPDKPIKMQGSTKKGIKIGRNVWIGCNVKILDGVEIGSNSILAAGTVVTRSVPVGAIVGGVPAKVIRFREGFETQSTSQVVFPS
jgi:acetyltransferase-like isoleucine patch superfamily enzyme